MAEVVEQMPCDQDTDDNVYNNLKPSDIKSVRSFFRMFFQSIGVMLLKFFISRHGVLTLTNVINGYLLMWMFAFGNIQQSNQVNTMIMFSIISLIILIYGGFIAFEKVKTSIDIGTPKK